MQIIFASVSYRRVVADLRLKKRNEKNIILISSKNMLGEDGEATVDGIHFTDLGMMRYADLVCPVIKKAIR